MLYCFYCIFQWLSSVLSTNSTLYLAIPETVPETGFIVPKCLAPTTFTSTLLVALHTNPLARSTEGDDQSVCQVPSHRMMEILYCIAVCKTVIGRRTEVGQLS